MKRKNLFETKLNDMIIILPGILGSVLQKNEKDLWAPTYKFVSNLFKPSGGELNELKLDETGGFSNSKEDGIKADRIFDQFIIIDGFFKKDIKKDFYSNLEENIKNHFKVITGSIHNDTVGNYFEFPYDWRRDNRVTAKKLKIFISKKLEAWRDHRQDPDAKVILVCHSMGGLIGRYYTEVLKGWKDCRALFTIGTPHHGASQALDYLVNGRKIIRADFTNLIRELPSVYQLLPLNEVIEYKSKYYKVSEVDNLPYIKKNWLQNSVDFHNEIAKKAKENFDKKKYKKSRFNTFPIVGTDQPTIQSLRYKDWKLTPSYILPNNLDSSYRGGDGTVPKFSAIPDDESLNNLFYRDTHVGLPNNKNIINQVVHSIELMQVSRNKSIRGSIKDVTIPFLSLKAKDVYLEKENCVFIVMSDSNDKDLILKARLIDLKSNSNLQEMEIQRTSSTEWKFDFGSLPLGGYRIKISSKYYSDNAPSSLSDIFQVIS